MQIIKERKGKQIRLEIIFRYGHLIFTKLKKKFCIEFKVSNF